VSGFEPGAGPNVESTPSNLGEVIIASEVVNSGPGRRHARNVIILLAASVGLMMTGFGIILPVFARRLEEFGSGVEALGLMMMSFALAQFVAAPIMGSLADRYGRRPIVLVGLAAFMIANIGFLLASSTTALILIRVFEGAFTAGIFPSAMGVVSDVVPKNQRAQWVGIVMGSYGAGLIFGPVLGGVLYDTWGFAAPFLASAAIALVALIAAAIMIPETRTPEVRWREKLRNRRATALAPAKKESLWGSLPRPLYLFVTLLILDFVLVFAFAFIEPQMVFYFYEELNWTTIQFGLVIGVYGLTMVLGQTLLGRLSDRFGRKPIIIVGSLFESIFYFGLIFFTSFPLILLVSAVSGIGTALLSPALSAYYLDISDERYRSGILGIKESSVALGGVVGPLLLVLFSASMAAQGIFIIAALTILASVVLAVIALPAQDRVVEKPQFMAWEYSENRALVAQSTLRGMVMRASTARDTTATTYGGRPANK
jgi:multidrug resistance protein